MGSIAISSQFQKALVWLRRDLRLTDHMALQAALDAADQVFIAFVFDSDILDSLPNHDRRVEFIHGAVTAVDAQLRKRGGGLHVLQGSGGEQILELAQQLKVESVFAARDYEPVALERDAMVRTGLAAMGCELILVKDHVIFEKKELLTGADKPYTVFTPYKKKWLANFELNKVRPKKISGWSRLAQEPVPCVPSLKDIGF